MKKAMILLILVLTVSQAGAFELSGADALDLEKKLEQIKVDAIEVANKTRAACMNTVGHDGYCTCMAQNLPVGMDFAKYVSTFSDPVKSAAKPKGPAEKKAFEIAQAARENCMKLVLLPPAQQGREGGH